MKINIQSKNIEITEAIHDYIEKRVTNLEKMLSQIEERDRDVQVLFDIARTTKHKAGEVFHADCLVNINGKKFYATTDREDLYEAIDELKDSLFSEISKNKDKKISMFHHGARKIKNIIKGIQNWKK